MISHEAVSKDVPLAPMTTYKVGGPADWYAEPKDLEELRAILAEVPVDLPVTAIGRGSNLVVSDDGVRGLVIRLGVGFAAIDATRPEVVAGGGTPLPVLARTATAAGRGGLEFYVGIPGSVGGAVRMNAGGHGSSTREVLDHALVLHVRTRSLDRRTPDELELSYRHSNLTDDDLVVQATFATTSVDPEEGEQLLREITRWRKEHQPGGTLNAGSVFKNPESDAAGAIIDRLGLKGHAIGPVSVSTLHANFMVATRDATATDIARFVADIRDRVESATGVRLEPEIRFLGDFDGAI